MRFVPFTSGGNKTMMKERARGTFLTTRERFTILEGSRVKERLKEESFGRGHEK